MVGYSSVILRKAVVLIFFLNYFWEICFKIIQLFSPLGKKKIIQLFSPLGKKDIEDHSMIEDHSFPTGTNRKIQNELNCRCSAS